MKDTAAESAARRAYNYRGHTVVAANLFHDEGTQILRSLIEEVGGVRTAAKLMQQEPESVSGWTREGLPKHFWAMVKGLYKAHKGTDDGTRQNPYCWDTQFSVIS